MSKPIYTLDIELKDNPVPYKRTTQKQKWVDKGYKKYQEWKRLLQIEFKKQNGVNANLEGAYYVEVLATYKNKKHGDTDNVAKGVNDALFKNDKYVSGAYLYNYADKARIKVNIYKENK